MTHCWTVLGLGFILLSTSVLSGSSYARPQEPGLGVGSEKSLGKSGSSNRKGIRDPGAEPVSKPEDRENSVGLHLLKNIAEDQKALWIGPKHLHWVDADWLVPLGGAAAAMFATDREYSKHLSNSPNRIKYSKDLSNYGLASMVGIGGGLYLWGHLTHDDHKIETGILAGEAAIDSLTPIYAMKYAFGRERPLQDNYRGRFGQGGVSFPSEHAAAAWSIASVIAHEYPGPLTSLFVYGLASAVSASRISGKQHFPSDVLVGSAIGWLEGMYVYRKHHDPTVGGGEWETYAETQQRNLRSGANMGSPYVALDSWIYPALERLIAQAYISDAMVGMRPWTRMECARFADEAQDHLQDDPSASPATQRLIETLAQEFRSEKDSLGGGDNRHLRLESLYTRVTGIAGQPLTDGFHFGQTLINDYGRPYAEGVNDVTGFSGWTSSGRFVVSVRGEYQHAPSIPAFPTQARQFIATSYGTVPVPSDTATTAVDHFQVLDAYVGFNVDNWQLSFGKQSLWWGPSQGGPMQFTDNAAPITMFRIDRVSPFKLPSILGWLGPIRVQFFIGQLAGHNFIFDDLAGLVGQWGRPLDRQPGIHGEKISFKPTANFEFSVSSTTLFAGGPTPFNWHSLGKAFTSFNVPVGNQEDITSADSVVDFSYKVPGLRNWLTFYGEAYAKDEYSPLGYPRKSAYEGGIYIPRFPGLPKLDLRAEGGSTNPPDFGSCVGCFFTNGRFLSGYTNEGNPIGSWLGRAGQGEQAWSTYWLSSRNKIQLHYRHQKAVANFVPGGGTVNDAGVNAEFWMGTGVRLSGGVQYEKWNYPLLDPLPRSNVTTSLEISFWPHFLK